MEANPQLEKLVDIFMPEARRRIKAVEESNTLFAHYTSARAAFEFLRPSADGHSIWLRNAMVMNDFSEIEYGNSCFLRAFNGPIGSRLKSVLSNVPGLLDEFIEWHKGISQLLRADTFLFSVSEHKPDDDLGRLSMWRAYGGDNGVALVFDHGPFLRESSAVGAYSTPVFYGDQEKYDELFDEIVRSAEENLELLLAVPRETLDRAISNAVYYSILSTKHPGFEEELEWRVVYDKDNKTDRIQCDFVEVSGIPQRIYKMPLRDYPDEGFYGATLPDILKKVIIGPTVFPHTIGDTIAGLLEQAGIVDPWSRIKISNIPLRR